MTSVSFEVPFIIDEFCLINALVSEDFEELESIVETIEVVSEKQFSECLLSSDFYGKSISNRVVADIIFQDFLYDPDVRDLFRRLTILIDSVDKFDPSVYLLVEDDVALLETSEALLCLKSRDEGACIISDKLSKPIDLNGIDWWKRSSMDFISKDVHIPLFLRRWVIHRDFSEDDIWMLKADLFGNLYFYMDDLRFSDFGLGNSFDLSVLIKHLSFLNDNAQTLYSERRAEFVGIASAMGVSVSPESPNTHRNGSAVKEREIEIAGNVIYCEWHTKLTPTTGRIHFHFGLNFSGDDASIKKSTNGKLLIGIFADHLST